MKKRKMLLYVMLINIVMCFSESFTNNSISISPISLLSVLGANESDSYSISDIWISLSLNKGNGKKEADYEICAIPNYADISIQKRNYSRDNCSGFFYGSFLSLEYMKLSIIPGDNIEIKSEIGSSKSDGNDYYLVGFRYGGDIGYRFRIKNIGFTPKIGLAVPLFYCFGVDLENKNDLLHFYGLNAMLRCFDFGFKIDFFEK
jgi:hypothetical protein